MDIQSRNMGSASFNQGAGIPRAREANWVPRRISPFSLMVLPSTKRVSTIIKVSGSEEH